MRISTDPGDVFEEALSRPEVERKVSELGWLNILVDSAAYQLARDRRLKTQLRTIHSRTTAAPVIQALPTT
jgi:hypothetical protein